LGELAAVAPVGCVNTFEVFVEDAVFDSDDSCDSHVPFNAAMEVVGSPRAPEWSTLVQRGNKSDEELAVNFWSELGYIVHRHLGSGSLPRGRQAQVRCLLFRAGLEKVLLEHRRWFPRRRAMRRQVADSVKLLARVLALGCRGRCGRRPGVVMSLRDAAAAFIIHVPVVHAFVDNADPWIGHAATRPILLTSVDSLAVACSLIVIG
jgi:hypothetical protein